MASEFLNQVTNDPGHTSLRRGLRAAVAAPVLLALSSTLGLPQAFTIYLNFAALGLLVFADFGGETPSRVRAYLVATLAGLPLIIVGTFASASIPTALVASLVAGFTVAEIAVLGGYFLSAQTPLTLAFVLSVTSPASFDVLADRLIGWALGGIVSALAGWLLWPHAAVGLVSTAAWLGQLIDLLHELEAPVAETITPTRAPWFMF